MDEVKNIDENVTAMGGMFPTVLRDLENYKENHRFLLILSCSFAELLVSVLIEEYCVDGKRINNNNRDFPFSVRLTLLKEMKILPDIQYTRLNWLRKQRNDAAHQANFKFTKDRLPDWGGEQHKEPEKLFSLCVNILGVFWNQYVELYRERLSLAK